MKQLAAITTLVVLFVVAYLLTIEDTFAGSAFEAAYVVSTTAAEITLPAPSPAREPVSDTVIRTPSQAADRIRSQLARHERLIFALYDFETGETFSAHERISVFPASLIKTLYMAVYLEQAQLGSQSPDTIHRLKEEDYYVRGTAVKGMGFLQTQPPGNEYSHEELLYLMMSQSDNIATNILVNSLGMTLINERAAAYGLKRTRAGRLMFEHNSAAPENRTTVEDLTALLVALENRQIVDGSLYRTALTAMQNAHKTRIGKYPPDGVCVANKIGHTDTVIGDMALIYFPQREPLALTVVIQSQGAHKLNRERSEELIAEFASDLMNYYMQQNRQ